jgi:hypothetical protein
MDHCTICGVKLAQKWSNGLCIFCDWYIGEGYSEEQIKLMIKEKGHVQENFISKTKTTAG